MDTRLRNIQNLQEEIVRLGPWHYDVQVTPDISTRVYLESAKEDGCSQSDPIPFLDRRRVFQQKLEAVYPHGLEGRRVLDCACNCGAYLFWTKELGAGDCFGFDVREHWIEQGRFLLENRTVGVNERIRLEVCDLYELPTLDLEPFDVTLFQGIFYHLPDVVHGLKLAADLTRELIVVNTATWNDFPDGFLAVAGESATHELSGAYGLNWYPTGPRVVARILSELGFPESRLVFRHRDTAQQSELGRTEVIAARDISTLADWDALHADCDQSRVENLSAC